MASSWRRTRTQMRPSATGLRRCVPTPSPTTSRRSSAWRGSRERRSASSDGASADAFSRRAAGTPHWARSLRVAILGVGLIGGSIGLASRRRVHARVSGYDPDERVRAKALELGAIDEPAADVPSAVKGADIVFVAAPGGVIEETVREALGSAPRD